MQPENMKIRHTSALPLGAEFTDGGIRFSAVMNREEDCGVLLYFKENEKPIKVPFPKDCFRGRICSMEIQGVSDCVRYLLYNGAGTYPDPYMRASFGGKSFGEHSPLFSVVTPEKIKENNTNSRASLRPEIPFGKSIFYMLHVRGFTAHSSSKVKAGGTFRGLIDKLMYIKKLGVTSVILMPVYEFNELIPGGFAGSQLSEDNIFSYKENVPEHIIKLGEFTNTGVKQTSKVNFWGYCDGYFYTPKCSFSAGDNPAEEFHELVDKAHDMGLEILLQFKFPQRFTGIEIIQVLRFWSEAYSVDGFQLIGGGLPMEDILRDPLLYGLKILYDERAYVSGEGINPEHGHVDMGFLEDMRCFLKGDPNYAEAAAMRLRDADPGRNPINTLARQDTMRLADIVAYNEKHNQDNGENGRDGTDYNYSWNCGVEGETRKKSISVLRTKQIKNALALMILSQGSPLIYSGDEFGNTQYGNNNPYNQDNDTGYIKWSSAGRAKELLEFTEKLIEIRKSHPCFGSGRFLTGRDQLSMGMPDVSLHGEALWRPDLGSSSHTFGILYYNRYFNENDKRLIYIIFNMHWEKQSIALPAAEGWKVELTSDITNIIETAKEITMAPRSMAVLEAVFKNEH